MQRALRIGVWSVIVLLVVSLFAPIPASAAPTTPNFIRLQVVPQTVQAGQSATIVLSLNYAYDQLCCGELTLTSPSGAQVLIVPVVKGKSGLESNLQMSSWAEGGKWVVSKLVLFTADRESLTLERGAGFSFDFTVSAQKADLEKPALVKIGWESDTVPAGAPAELVATVKDSGDAGVSEVNVTLAPDQESGDPLWENPLRLTPTADPSVWKGTFLAPVMAIPLGTVRAVRAEVADAAGNRTTLSAGQLRELNAAALHLTKADAISALQTEPYLINVIHPGAYSFLDWNERDADELGSLFDRMAAEPDAVRAVLNWQLLTLVDAVTPLRQEIYEDPVSHFRLVPLNTSGKWVALDKAFQARVTMMGELQRRAGQGKQGLVQKGEILAQAQITRGPSGALTAISPEAYADGGPALMAAVLRTINASSLPAGLMAAGHKAPSTDDTITLLDRDLIWFMPFQHDSALAEHYYDGREIFLYLNQFQTPQQVMFSLLHELGHHYSEVFMGSDRATQPSAVWDEYLSFRGHQAWLTRSGWSALPGENFAEDFAYALLPDNLRPQYRERGAFPPLAQEPAQLQAFRDYVTRTAKLPADPSVQFDQPGYVLVGATAVTGTFAPDKTVRWRTTGTEPLKEIKTDGGTGRFSLQLPVSTDPFIAVSAAFETVEGEERTSRQTVCKWKSGECWVEVFKSVDPGPSHQRSVLIINAPVTPKELALRVTNQPEVTILEGNVRGTLSVNGKDGATATLSSGENTLAVKVAPPAGAKDSTPYSLSVPIYYEPASSAALTVQPPLPVAEPEVVIKGATLPRSVVRAGGASTTSDRFGKFALKVGKLKAGENALTVTATTPGGTVRRQTVSVTVAGAGGSEARPVGAHVTVRARANTALVNGEEQPLQVPAQMIGETLYVPLRFLANALGGKVELDLETDGMRATVGEHSVVVQAESPEAIVDSVHRTMPGAATMVENRMLVPLRFVCEALGARVRSGSGGATEIVLSAGE